MSINKLYQPEIYKILMYRTSFDSSCLEDKTYYVCLVANCNLLQRGKWIK